jgi:hypothetical protein
MLLLLVGRSKGREESWYASTAVTRVEGASALAVCARRHALLRCVWGLRAIVIYHRRARESSAQPQPHGARRPH